MRQGTGMKAGGIVLTGSFTGFHPVEAGRPVTGSFDGFGEVSAQISS
jgi:2-keto-4-pentenoate hydratase